MKLAIITTFIIVFTIVAIFIILLTVGVGIKSNKEYEDKEQEEALKKTK